LEVEGFNPSSLVHLVSFLLSVLLSSHIASVNRMLLLPSC
jgi:hypothetical protein